MTLKHSLRLAFALLLAAFPFNFVLSAQTETANISGLVSDASGAPVAKAHSGRARAQDFSVSKLFVAS